MTEDYSAKLQQITETSELFHWRFLGRSLAEQHLRTTFVFPELSAVDCVSAPWPRRIQQVSPSRPNRTNCQLSKRILPRATSIHINYLSKIVVCMFVQTATGEFVNRPGLIGLPSMERSSAARAQGSLTDHGIRIPTQMVHSRCPRR